MKLIDINTWNRKEHYEFFSKMDSPYFGIVAEVDCTKAYAIAKTKKRSFFAHYFHKSMQAINCVEAFKYRIIDESVYVFDIIHAGTTIARADGTFGFIYVPFSEDFDIFNSALESEILAVQNSTGLRLNNDDLKKDLIRHSTLPWINFSAVLHPTSFKNKESVPKIVFGKYVEKEGKKMMPVSVEGHHGLLDGYHIALYLEAFQKLLNEA